MSSCSLVKDVVECPKPYNEDDNEDSVDSSVENKVKGEID